MELRDKALLKFALQAPFPAPDWFQPLAMERPKEPHLEVPDQYRVPIVNHFQRDVPLVNFPPEVMDSVRKYKAELEEYHDDMTTWEVSNEKQRLIQWPFAYAKMVIDASEKA